MNVKLPALTRWTKRSIAFASDVFFTFIAWMGCDYLTNNTLFTQQSQFYLIILISGVHAFFYWQSGLYRGIWRFASIPDLIRIIRAIALASLLNFGILAITPINLSLKSYFIFDLLLVICLSGTRLLFRWLRDYRAFFSQGKRVLVAGAGSAGDGLMRELYRSAAMHHYVPVAFVDDDPNRIGCDVQGIPVLGTCSDIPKLVKHHDIELILIAIPSASATRMREIVTHCENARIPFRTLPGIKDIADGSVKIDSLREVLLEDLLGREPISHDIKAIQLTLQNKSILVTGGGGSIGSELCRQLSKLNPEELIIIDNNEFNLYHIDLELRKIMPSVLLHTYLCNVTDPTEINKIFNLHHPDMVFHVAAYKHVPLLESHLRIAMYNNIIGTKIMAEFAEQFNVDTFVLISTDKAVNPTSIMGATKRAAEVFCQAFNTQANTRFITVRFGNVLDSAGSVIPLFRKQLLEGGPLTVTHPDITRYFMTIPEAAQLILQTTTMNDEGEIFVLDMGEPINISYLAEQMIKLSGKTINKDIKIEYTGLRPGEKIHEELFHDAEDICATSHHKIHQAKVRKFNFPEVQAIIDSIIEACQTGDEYRLLSLLCQLVPEYLQRQITDITHTSTSKVSMANYSYAFSTKNDTVQ